MNAWKLLRALAWCAAIFATVTTTPALAQDNAEVDRLKSAVSEMEKMILQMKGQIDELQKRQPAPPATTTVTPAATNPPPAAATKAVTVTDKPVASEANLADQDSRMRHRDTVLGDNVAAPRPGNAPVDPTYAGFMPLFGTTTWLKLGGYAKVDAIADSTKVGNPSKFVTGTIPVPGEANFGKGEEFNLHAKQTRVNFELRSPTRLGSLKIFYENDFFGNSASSGMDYNLRHFYGQLANVTVGQTWTTFLDPDAIPDTLDFAGPGVQSIVRQPQVRYTFSPIREHMHVALAIEEPNSDLSALPATGTSRNIAPDFTGHWRWEGRPGHVQVGGLARVLAWDNSAGADDSTFAWGMNVSGVLHTWGKDSMVGNFTIGEGIGRYMQDLPGGSGAVVDAAGDLNALSVWGAMVGYRHFWCDAWRSEVTYGYVEMDNRSEQGAKAYDHTHYVQANLVWSPVARFYVGVEYLFGVKTSRDDSEGHAHRAQVSFQYKLF